MITLKGPFALGFDSNNKPVSYTHLWRDDLLSDTLKASGSAVNDSIGTIETKRVVSYVNLWAHNYFHFVTECLASLIMMNRHTFDNVLIVPHPSKYIVEGLLAIGLNTKAKMWGGQATGFTDLVEPYQARYYGYSTPESLRALRDWLLGDGGRVRKIYVSREDAFTRRVFEEKVPPTYLKAVSSSLSFMHQVSLFSGAQVIAGPHGAGLTNMIWAPKGCNIIEFFGTYENDCFEKLAETLGHHYTKVPCAEKDGEIVIESGAL